MLSIPPFFKKFRLAEENNSQIICDGFPFRSLIVCKEMNANPLEKKKKDGVFFLLFSFS